MKKFAHRLFIIVAVLLVAFVLLVLLLSYFSIPLADRWGLSSTLLITLAIQSLVVFVGGGLLSAYFVFDAPLSTLGLTRVPPSSFTFVSIVAMVAAIPSMNLLITWNESWSLPASMSIIEEWLQRNEASAKSVTDLLLSQRGIGYLLANMGVVGVLAAVGEELLFRGVIQRVLIDRCRNVHIAIWSTALLFSLIHLQFYGLIPRMLYGAFFGYLFVWSGSLWVPIVAHLFNNALGVAVQYAAYDSPSVQAWEEVGTHSIPLTVASLLLVASIVYYLYRARRPVDYLRGFTR